VRMRLVARTAVTAVTFDVDGGDVDLSGWLELARSGPGVLVLDGVLATCVHVGDRVAAELDLGHHAELVGQLQGNVTAKDVMLFILLNYAKEQMTLDRGGAHMKYFMGGAYTTDFLQWLVRDEQRLTLEEAHYRLSALPAHAAGFRDRGTLREGGWADVVVYDLNQLGVEGELAGEIVYDLPGGEWRRVQRARGYRAIIVNGQITFDEGKPTGATPGKLLRHGRA